MITSASFSSWVYLFTCGKQVFGSRNPEKIMRIFTLWFWKQQKQETGRVSKPRNELFTFLRLFVDESIDFMKFNDKGCFGNVNFKSSMSKCFIAIYQYNYLLDLILSGTKYQVKVELIFGWVSDLSSFDYKQIVTFLRSWRCLLQGKAKRQTHMALYIRKPIHLHVLSLQ